MGYMMDFLRAGGLEGAVLSLGYPTSPPEGGRLALPKGRKPLSELVHEERYGRRRASAEGTDVDGARSS